MRFVDNGDGTVTDVETGLMYPCMGSTSTAIVEILLSDEEADPDNAPTSRAFLGTEPQR